MKYVQFLILPGILLSWLLSVFLKPNPETITRPSRLGMVALSPAQENLLKTRCYVCHTEKPGEVPENQMKAPPMWGVRMHYIRRYPDKTVFIQRIKEWVKHPEKSKSLMPGAIKRFGLMPALPYPDEELTRIAEAIYHLPKPSMMQRHRCGGGRCGRGK